MVIFERTDCCMKKKYSPDQFIVVKVPKELRNFQSFWCTDRLSLIIKNFNNTKITLEVLLWAAAVSVCTFFAKEGILYMARENTHFQQRA